MVDGGGHPAAYSRDTIAKPGWRASPQRSRLALGPWHVSERLVGVTHLLVRYEDVRVAPGHLAVAKHGQTLERLVPVPQVCV
jgi:hypothetical protein